MYAKIDMYPARIANDTQEQVYVCAHGYVERTNKWIGLRPNLDCEIINPGEYADYGASDIYFAYYTQHALPKNEETGQATEIIRSYCLGPEYEYSKEEIEKQEQEFWGDIISNDEMTPWEELKAEVDIFGQFKEMNKIFSKTINDLGLNSYYNWSDAIEFDPSEKAPQDVEAVCGLLRTPLYLEMDKDAGTLDE